MREQQDRIMKCVVAFEFGQSRFRANALRAPFSLHDHLVWRTGHAEKQRQAEKTL